jgi:hypothetical protein
MLLNLWMFLLAVPWLVNSTSSCLPEGAGGTLWAMEYEKVGAALIARELLTEEDWRGLSATEIPSRRTSQASAQGRFKARTRAGDRRHMSCLTWLRSVRLTATSSKGPSDLAFKRLALPLRRENGTVVSVTDPERTTL